MARRRNSYFRKYSNLSYKPIPEIELIIQQAEDEAASCREKIDLAQAEVARLRALDDQCQALHAERERLIAENRKSLGLAGVLRNITRGGVSEETAVKLGAIDAEIKRLNQALNPGFAPSYRRPNIGLSDAERVLRNNTAALEFAKTRLANAQNDLEGARRRAERELKQREAAERRESRERERKIQAEEAAERAKQKRDSERAEVEAARGRTREHATRVRRELRTQLEIFDFCPYCGGLLGENPHSDHIYPVSRGGHSTRENMIIICQQCNLRKGDKTLREFILQYSLDRDVIEQRLERLGKRF